MNEHSRTCQPKNSNCDAAFQDEVSQLKRGDGLTYTFTLQDNVLFHDGSAS
jgi:hypothetical protein